MRCAVAITGATGGVARHANGASVALAALLAAGAAASVANDATGGAAELFAITFAMATGAIATDADAGVAAFRTALARSGRAGADAVFPDLASGAFRNGGRWDWPAGGIGWLPRDAGVQTAQTEQPLEQRAPVVSGGK